METCASKLSTFCQGVQGLYPARKDFFYQDYDTYDISGLFYNVTKIDEKCIFELSYDDDKCDLHLEANLEKDNFGLKVKSRKEKLFP